MSGFGELKLGHVLQDSGALPGSVLRSGPWQHLGPHVVLEIELGLLACRTSTFISVLSLRSRWHLEECNNLDMSLGPITMSFMTLCGLLIFLILFLALSVKSEVILQPKYYFFKGSNHVILWKQRAVPSAWGAHYI